MDCRQTVKLLPLFIDEALNIEQATLVADHLALCLGCRTKATEFRRQQKLLRSLPRVIPPSNWHDELLANTSRKPSAIPLGAGKFFVPRLTSLAAGLVAILLVTNLYVFPLWQAKESGPFVSLYSSKSMDAEAPPATFGLATIAPEAPEGEKLRSSESPEAAEGSEGIEDAGIPVLSAMGSRGEDALSGDELTMVAEENSLEKRFWLYSTLVAVLLWFTGGLYLYRSFRRRWQLSFKNP